MSQGKKRITSLRRFLCSKLGGIINEDIPTLQRTIVHHDIIQYDLYKCALVIDERMEIPSHVHREHLVRQLSLGITPYVTFTEHRNRYAPYQKEMIAELWVGR